MNKLSAILVLFLLTTIAYSQNKPLALEKVSVATFESAKARKAVGIEEIGRMRFKYEKGESLTNAQSGTSNGYTWFSIVEKAGSLLITDSVKAAGVSIKINGIEREIDFKSTLYRNVDGKVKKVKLEGDYLQVIEKGDTSVYTLNLQSAQPNDILQISYTVTSRIIYTTRWLMINEISPGTISRFDLYTPSYLQYKIAFKGFKADQIKSTSEQSDQIISYEKERSFIPTKNSSELTSVTATVIHGSYVFKSPSKLKYVTATLVEETRIE